MNSHHFLCRIRNATAGFLLAAAHLTLLANPATTQSITLNPGWNAIYTQVLPANADLSAVFSGLAVESLWTYENRVGAPDFIQEVSEQSLAAAGWLSWVPTNRVEAFQNDLLQLQVNRAYLLKYTGGAAITLTLNGRPALRTPAWQPDAFNFRGFPVDPAFLPTFLSFFRPSSAHYAASTGLKPIYRLNASGAWELVAPTDLVQAGRAYWVFCQGASDYAAPLTVRSDLGDGLEYGSVADELNLHLQNLGAASINVTLKDLGAPNPNPLSYAERLPDTTLTWPSLPDPLVRTLAAGTISRERLAVRRADMPADLFESVLEITDGAGSRFLVPISAFRPSVPTSTPPPPPGGPPPPPSPDTHAGLWMGTATISKVSEAHSGPLTTNVSQGYTVLLETNVVTRIVTTNLVPNSVTRTQVSMTPTPTGSDFNLRLILHVDASGQTRLLKDVIQMWQDGTTTNDLNGVAVVDRPGRLVLLTDVTQIGQFTGVSARDGVPVGRRLSTAGFDFADNELPLSGQFGLGSIVRGTNAMSDTFARNPLKHRYHPDHAKGFQVTRVLELEFASTPPANAPPNYGEDTLDGIYRETVTGLHRTNIVVGGTFRLKRLTTTAVLNQ